MRKIASKGPGLALIIELIPKLKPHSLETKRPPLLHFFINGENDVDHWQLDFWISTVLYSVSILLVVGYSDN